MRVEQIGNCTLYLGNSLEIVPTLTGIDAVITDPPYGVGLGKNGATSIGKTAYDGFDDTPEYITSVAVPVINAARAVAKRAMLTPGSRNVFLYDKPDEIGCIFNPAGAGFSRWGFTTSQPIIYYGKDPHTTSKRPHSVQSCETVEKNGHPCPKPINLMKWMVDRASLPGETVLDPFMGSGTTGVACVMLDRQFVGIELTEKYFDIARRRIEDALKQPKLFESPKPKPTQLGLLDGEAA